MKKTDVTTWEQLPLIMNVQEVAGLIGCGEQTIRMLCHAKEIPHFKHGRAFLFLARKDQTMD